MVHQSLKEQPHHSHSTSAWDMRTTKMNWLENTPDVKIKWEVFVSPVCNCKILESLPSQGQSRNTGSQRLSWTSPWRPSLWPSNSDCYKPWSTNVLVNEVCGSTQEEYMKGYQNQKSWYVMMTDQISKCGENQVKRMLISVHIYTSLTKLEICWKVRKRHELAWIPCRDFTKPYIPYLNQRIKAVSN